MEKSMPAATCVVLPSIKTLMGLLITSAAGMGGHAVPCSRHASEGGALEGKARATGEAGAPAGHAHCLLLLLLLQRVLEEGRNPPGPRRAVATQPAVQDLQARASPSVPLPVDFLTAPMPS